MAVLYDTVLVADDDEKSVGAVREALEGAGLRVVTLAKPAKLVAVMDRNVPAVVVLDPEAFGGSGWQVLLELRRDARYVPIPVIVLTAPMPAGRRAMAFEQGAQQYAEKPIDAGEIVARVRSLIEHRHQISKLFSSETRAMRRIPASAGSRRVPLMIDDVLYFDSLNKSVRAHTSDGVFEVDATLGELADSFGDDEFMRVHRSFLVHMPYVHGLERKQGELFVVMEKDGRTELVPVSRRRSREVHDALHL
jgi:DNA-binding LytR/AlgR family response regulator